MNGWQDNGTYDCRSCCRKSTWTNHKAHCHSMQTLHSSLWHPLLSLWKPFDLDGVIDICIFTRTLWGVKEAGIYCQWRGPNIGDRVRVVLLQGRCAEVCCDVNSFNILDMLGVEVFSWMYWRFLDIYHFNSPRNKCLFSQSVFTVTVFTGWDHSQFPSGFTADLLGSLYEKPLSCSSKFSH